MSWPRHANPNPERTARAPYNFVPLPEAVVTVERTELPDQSRYHPDRYTGHLECTLTTESPLYIRCAAPDGATEEEMARFFYIDNPNRPVIPGSSLRGMLRTLVEILSYSKVQLIAPQPLYYRAVADLTLGREYRQYILRVKAGYMTRLENGRFGIIPARLVNGRTFFKVREERLLSLPNFIPMLVNGKKNEKYKPGNYSISFQPPSGRDGRGRPMERIREVGKPGDFRDKACVVCSGYIEGKHNHTLVTAPGDGRPLEIPEQVEKSYRESLTDFIKKNFDERNGCLTERHPVFYVEQAGNVEAFGHTSNFRVPYRQAGRTATTCDFVPEALHRPDDLDLTEAIFGFTKTLSDGATDSYAGRVSFTDAHLEPNQDDYFYAEETITPRILSSPKPTTFQQYLTQALPDRPDTLKHYGSQTPQETVIRGHKFYWHQGEVLIDDIEETETIKPEDKQHTRIQPVRSGLNFRFCIYFENLTNVELGALLWAIRLPGDDSENYRHKLGMGKPLGMGSVKLETNLYLTDRQPRSHGLARYDRLFDEDETWETGRISLPENVNTVQKAIRQFEQYVLDRLPDVFENARFCDQERIKTLLRMLEWPGPESKEAICYMKLDEFRRRPVLPTPIPILRKRGITRVRIQNYKSLGDVDVRLGKLTILVGQNGSGKSNFLDALRFLKEAIEDLPRALTDWGGIEKLRRWSPPKEDPHGIQITINLEDDQLQAEYHVEIKHDGRVARERCLVKVQNESDELDILDGVVRQPSPLNASSVPTERLALLRLSGVPAFDSVVSYLRKTAFYAIEHRALREPQSLDRGVHALSETGANLASIWQRMELAESEWLSDIISLLRRIVMDVADVEVRSVGRELLLYLAHDWGDEPAPTFEAGQESDGTLRLLGLLTALYQEPTPILLGIEEPELNIHPGALRALFEAFGETSQARSQVIITTHSPELLDRARASDVRIVEKVDGVTFVGEMEETQRYLVRAKLLSSGELLKEGLSRE